MAEPSQSQQQQSQIQQSQDEPPKQQSKAQGILNLLFVRKWHPQPTVTTTILIFAVVGVLFIVLGVVISIFNSTIIEIEESGYESEKKCEPIGNNPDDKNCILEVFVNEADLEPPIYLFYTIDNFYQNHRRYMKSKSTTQLAGSVIDKDTAESDCDPIVLNKDLGLTSCSATEDLYYNYKGDCVLKPDDVANPCGLIAKSLFTDSYRLFTDPQRNEADEIKIDQEGISWPEDKGKKYKQPDDDAEKALQWVNPENEHFIVWMRTSGLPNFRKLWGKIDTKLEKGKKYYFEIYNSYNVDAFKGSKGIVLSTAGPLGGKNYFLNAGFLVVGVICIIIALIFMFKRKITGGTFGEPKPKQQN